MYGQAPSLTASLEDYRLAIGVPVHINTPPDAQFGVAPTSYAGKNKQAI
jgi:hypothetical protein